MSMEIVNQAMRLQSDTVEKWHLSPVQIEDAVTELLFVASAKNAPNTTQKSLLNNRVWLETICQQHRYNYQLWHQEDIARSPVVTDAEMAKVKRAIDGFNQKRNDWIEKIDDLLTQFLEDTQVAVAQNARLNTETPGSVLDRLSIMALRLYHLQEQLDRHDATDEHRTKVEQKIAICKIQHADLGNSLSELLDDIFCGVKKHRTYRQCKMYNDPTMNPEVYTATRKAG